MRRSSRENLCKKQYCNVTKTNRFVLKILEKLNHFVLKVRTGGFADSNWHNFLSQYKIFHLLL